MKAYQQLLWAAVAFLTVAMANAGSLEFVNKSLGLDIAKTPFGSALANFTNAVQNTDYYNSWPVYAKFTWYRTDMSASYEAKHPRRIVEYGFKKNRLAAIRIFMGCFFDVEKEKNKEKPVNFKKSLDAIFSDFRKNGGEVFTLQDTNLYVVYEPLCNAQ